MVSAPAVGPGQLFGNLESAFQRRQWDRDSLLEFGVSAGSGTGSACWTLEYGIEDLGRSLSLASHLEEVHRQHRTGVFAKDYCHRCRPSLRIRSRSLLTSNEFANPSQELEEPSQSPKSSPHHQHQEQQTPHYIRDPLVKGSLHHQTQMRQSPQRVQEAHDSSKNLKNLNRAVKGSLHHQTQEQSSTSGARISSTVHISTSKLEELQAPLAKGHFIRSNPGAKISSTAHISTSKLDKLQKVLLIISWSSNQHITARRTPGPSR
jgi:hypothetical protein